MRRSKKSDTAHSSVKAISSEAKDAGDDGDGTS